MSIAEIHTGELLTPCRATMVEMLEHLFEHDSALAGRIEIACTGDTRAGRTALSNGRTFLCSELKEAASHAVSVNEQGCNIYVGAQLRHMNSPHIRRCKDEHAAGLTCAYVDLDEPGAVENALRVSPSLKPTLTVITGARPHLRAQLWWRLDAVCTDQQRVIRLLKALAQAFNGDPTVTNPGRVMRLAGSIAWPVKEGRVAEMTYIQRCRPDDL